MSTNLTTITVNSLSFNIRSEFKDVLDVLNKANYPHIQALIVAMFDLVDELYSDEYALAIYAFFPKSLAVNNRRARAAADVRKYNKREFAVQQDMEESDHQVRLIDSNTRSGGSDASHAADILSQL